MLRLIRKAQTGAGGSPFPKYKLGKGYRYQDLSLEDLKWLDSFLKDYKARWDKEHKDSPYDLQKIKDSINFYFGEDLANAAGRYNPITNNVVLSDFGEDKGFWAHELSHSLRSNLGWNNPVARRYNINTGTNNEEKKVNTVYKLYDPADSMFFSYNPYSHGEPYSVNTQIREQISQLNGGIKGQKLDEAIEKTSAALLLELYANAPYTVNPGKDYKKDKGYLEYLKKDPDFKSYSDEDKQALYYGYLLERMEKNPKYIRSLKDSLKTVAYNSGLTQDNTYYAKRGTKLNYFYK